MPVAPDAAERERINNLVKTYLEGQKFVSLFCKQIIDAFGESQELQSVIHSVKSRLKNPIHLREKLYRKLLHCKKEGIHFEIVKDNLFYKIKDLAGIRVLHLYTRQIETIDPIIKAVFREMNIDLIEGPFARTWDDESRDFFINIGIEAQSSPTMYTSVHYVVASKSKTLVAC